LCLAPPIIISPPTVDPPDFTIKWWPSGPPTTGGGSGRGTGSGFTPPDTPPYGGPGGVGGATGAGAGGAGGATGAGAGGAGGATGAGAGGAGGATGAGAGGAGGATGTGTGTITGTGGTTEPGTTDPIGGGLVEPTGTGAPTGGQQGEVPRGGSSQGGGGGSPTPIPPGGPIRMPPETGRPKYPIGPGGLPRPLSLEKYLAEEWMPEPASMSEPITSLVLADPAFNPYDMKYNYGIEANQDILELATTQTPNRLGLDPNGIYATSLSLVLKDVLSSKGANTFVPFNGVTIGSFLYQTNLVKNSLSQQTINSLDFLKNQNLTSYNIGAYLLAAIKQATYKGVIGDYNPRLFSTLAEGAASVFPNGLPTFSDPITNRNTALTLIRNKKISLNPQKYTESGDASRFAQRHYIVPTDIRLQASVVRRDSSICGVKFKADSAISVVKRDGTEEDVFETNEFLPVVRRDSSIRGVALYSDRDKAYKFNLSELSVILGLLGDRSTNPNAVSEYSVDLNVSATFGTEVTDGVSIPDAMLYSLVGSSITDQPPSTPDGLLRTTTAKYKRVWKEGDDSDDDFNSTVAAFSGPRQNFYIPADDPVWNFILEANATDSEFYIEVTYNDLDIPLDGNVYPRRILTDFCIFPTDKTNFNIFQGRSILNSYPEGETLTRSMSFIMSPFSDTKSRVSTKPVKATTGLNAASEPDLNAINFTKAFSAGDKIKLLSKTGESFSSKKSILGKFLTTLSDIDTNYDLQDGNLGKRLPMGDLFSFMDITDMLDLSMGQLSSGIINSLFFGQLNGIKLFSVKKTDSEKTYISSTRLKSGGASLESDQNQKTVPKIGYFPPAFKDILW
jgi:hypothetical protein